MKELIWIIVDKLNLDSLFSSSFRNNRLLNKFIPPSSYYGRYREKKIKIIGTNFIVNPSDLVQHTLLKPDLRIPEYYGIDKFIYGANCKYKENKVVVFDIGANCGQFSLLCIANFLREFPNKEIIIYAFEPNPFVYQLFLRNLKQNKYFEKYVKVLNVGLGESETSLTIQMPYRNSGAGSLLRNYEHEENLTTAVKIISMDQFCIQANDLKNINFMKIDVENFEPYVLKGGEETISRYLPDIYIEMGQKEEIQQFIFDYLWGKGYNLYAELKDQFISLNEFNNKEIMVKNGLYNVFATTSTELFKDFPIDRY